MAQVQSILGMVTGKLGNLRASNWNGINVLAQQPTSYTDANTPVQQDNRSTFKALAKAGRQAVAAIRQGLSQYSNRTSPWATYMKLSKDAFTMVNGAPKLTGIFNFIISRGDLPGIGSGSLVTNGTGDMVFTFGPNSAAFGALPTDRITIVAVAQDGSGAVVYPGIAARSAGTVTVNPPDSLGLDPRVFAFLYAVADPMHTSDTIVLA